MRYFLLNRLLFGYCCKHYCHICRMNSMQKTKTILNKTGGNFYDMPHVLFKHLRSSLAKESHSCALYILSCQHLIFCLKLLSSMRPRPCGSELSTIFRSSLYICTPLRDVDIVSVGQGAVSFFHTLGSEVLHAVVHGLLNLHVVGLAESGCTPAPPAALLQLFG